ncbi:MAG: single-stranded-DNA-specific exonuclease RecJ, partial [Coriobacteriia bacterium]|nr:single-stranded-DNA-specific exonuclease RecJ [Coriobacteriia bacterium]
ILLGRGITDPTQVRRFLHPDLATDWRAPSSIPGMVDAASVVAAAIGEGMRIAVFGDFDADGITATALLTLGLRALGAEVAPLLPHRLNDGYGLGPSSVARLIEDAPGLVVTVDCGIASAREVAELQRAGIGVVVTDHHEPADDVPTGVPVADPKLPGAPFPGLAGAGVALKLLQAVGEARGRSDLWLDYTDIAAIGTVADVVPLLDENRALVAHGVARMLRDPRPGIAALARVAGIGAGALDAERIAFGLAPRINAAGRMADPSDALELLLAQDAAVADEVALRLDEYNRARQSVEAELLAIALDQASVVLRPGDRALVLAGEGWHEGVKGIVAGRMAVRFGVPTLLFAVKDGVAHGSGRSSGRVDLHAAVASCAHLVTRFGGHAAAVGVTLPVEDLPAFTDHLKEALATLPSDAFEPVLALDAEIPLAGITREMVAEFAALAPFGHDNPRPLVATRGVFMNGRRRVGADGCHLKFEAYDGLTSIPAIAFRCPEVGRAAGTESAVDLAFHVEVDEWHGRDRLQLQVRDLVVHDVPLDSPAAELVDGLFADADRILARGDYEGIADAESFHTKLAGVTFEGRQDVVARLTAGAPLRLQREPENPYDTCACAVFDPLGDQVGFLNRRLAAVLAPAIDEGAVYDVSVSEVTGGENGESLGVNVLVVKRVSEDGIASEDRSARRAELAALPLEALDAELVRHLIGERKLHSAQARSLAHLGGGRSCLTVMATGRGKSLIFHVHAARIALTQHRASVFVYPLRALVADQAFHVTESFARLGLSVGVITGETALATRDEVFASLGDGLIDVLMTTPEFLQRHADRFAGTGRVGFVVIDEAHHVGLARAGHRPAYSRLEDVLETLGRPTVFACTATAGDDVAGVIRSTLGIEETVLDPSVRDNLSVADRRGSGDKVVQLAALAARGDKTIVYVNSREQSIRLASKIREASAAMQHRTAFYNGGMARPARHAVERAFREGAITAVVATSAFGEGVNIPDVRHVVLFHVPFNRVEFNQMCGRCGRDGAPATVHLLFGERDARLNELIIESTAPDADDLRALYAVVRDRSAASGDGWVEATNADLAEDVRLRRPKTRLSDKGVSTGVGVFRELGLVTGEGLGGYRRLRLEPAPEAKVDLASSVRYGEGLEEARDFSEFRTWVITSPADDLLHAFNRPILPGG